MKNIRLSQALIVLAAILGSSPTLAQDNCGKLSVTWSVDPTDQLAIDPHVSVQTSVWGNMVLLEHVQSELNLKFLDDLEESIRFRIIPIVGENGLLLADGEFDVTGGQQEASKFVSYVCKSSHDHSLKLHGWQADYIGKLLDGSYELLPIEIVR